MLPAPVACLGLLGLWLGTAAFAAVHDPGLSAADFRFAADRLVAHLTFARVDIEPLVLIDADGDGHVTPAELAAARPRLVGLAREALEVWFDGRGVPPSDVTAALDESNGVHLRLSFFFGRPGEHVRLRSAILARMARGHRQYLSLEDRAGNVLAERMLDATADGLELRLTEAVAVVGAARSFRQFLVLGVEHILTGYDHLAFLLALLLVIASFRTAAVIITSFTLAHSLTLALATLDVARLPSRLVEALIAVSIVYVGLENVVRRTPSRRWLVTFGFGLVHGFGFASALRALGIGSGGGGIAVPLFSFNLGVELGQMTLAGAALPCIWKLRHHPAFVSKAVPACSVLVSLAGLYLLIKRTVLL